MSGTQNVGIAVENKFRANIKNDNTSAVTVALFSGHYPTLGLTTTSASGALTSVKVHYHDISELTKAGVSVTTILDDDTVKGPNDQNIAMSAADPNYTIRSFHEYIKLNPMILTSMTIHASNPTAYGGSLRLQKTNPFNRPSEIPVELDKFFDVSQFQDNKINISFVGSEIEVADDLLMTFVVPGGSEVGVTFRFSA
ncbi:MAG: hypothetical protein LBG80_00270 [Bacteroidales bacterium]|nr:hypothetical protein [Bacteroidales bacterium]